MSEKFSFCGRIIWLVRYFKRLKRALLEIVMMRLNRGEEAIWATTSTSPWIRSKLASVVWRAHAARRRTDACASACRACIMCCMRPCTPPPPDISPSIILCPIVTLRCIVGKFHCCEMHCWVEELLEAHCKKWIKKLHWRRWYCCCLSAWIVWWVSCIWVSFC